MEKILDRNVDLGPFVPQPDDDIIICRCEEVTCGKLVQSIVARELGVQPTELDHNTARTPARPIEMSVYGNEIIEQEVEK